jgi:hypothetical protein
MVDPALPNAPVYAARYRLQLAERLGSGRQGTVFVAHGNAEEGQSAVKVHHSIESYLRERAVYNRLREAGIVEILGFNVPQLIRFDDELRAIEMTIVERPFVLDFASAWLDARPEFPEDAWVCWAADKREQFEERWEIVQEVIAAFAELGIHLLDVSPSNIAFVD